MAERADTVVTCWPDAPEVKEVVVGPNGLLAPAAVVIIDTSTIDPQAAQAVAAQVAEQGCYFVDAPMSGGEAGAIAGTLTFMIGGDPGAVEASQDVFKAMGQKTYYVGGPGTGQAESCATT